MKVLKQKTPGYPGVLVWQIKQSYSDAIFDVLTSKIAVVPLTSLPTIR
jgi:hypothetical protein